MMGLTSGLWGSVLLLVCAVAGTRADGVGCNANNTAADVVFIIDASSSVEDTSAGGSEGAFTRATDFAACVTTLFGTGVAPNKVRIAAVSFSNRPKKNFDYSQSSSGLAVTRRLRKLKYTGADGVTKANLHLALRLTRKRLVASAGRWVSSTSYVAT